jgi:hypothetical protein
MEIERDINTFLGRTNSQVASPDGPRVYSIAGSHHTYA